jgi:hypothetical protein
MTGTHEDPRLPEVHAAIHKEMDRLDRILRPEGYVVTDISTQSGGMGESAYTNMCLTVVPLTPPGLPGMLKS